MNSPALRIERLDPSRGADADTLLALLDAYARDPAGGREPLSARTRERLAPLLAGRSDYIGFVARTDREPVGLVNCFEGVSTFKAAPLLNVHDVYVTPAWRGRGVARRLLEAAEDAARSRGCCKLTLEVLDGNAGALALYRRIGFEDYRLDPSLGRALFLQKWLA